MSEKYIRKNKNSFTIIKNSKTYSKTSNLEDAIFIRDLLVSSDWNLSAIPNLVGKEDYYVVLSVFDEKIHMVAKYRQMPSQDTIDNLIKRHRRNPNNSRYGLNITRVFDTFVIRKRIFGDDYVFGYYDRLEDAQFVRNFLMDNDWNVNALREIEFDEEANVYRVISVIDDAAYVLDTFDTPDIDLSEVHREFLLKISKHKHGLADYPHLDPLKDRIGELESRFGVKADDDVWSLDGDISSPLDDIIFTLTPFQQSVFDAITSKTTRQEIEQKLIRYKSKNFTQKIEKNLKELIELGLIKEVSPGCFKKT